MAKTDFLTADMTRRQFMKISGKSLAGLTLSASMLSLFGCSQKQVDSGAVATWALPQGLLVVNADLCTGCQRCEINCTLTNDGVCSSYISRVKIQRRLNLDGAGNGLLSGNDNCFVYFPDALLVGRNGLLGTGVAAGGVLALAAGIREVDKAVVVAGQQAVARTPPAATPAPRRPLRPTSRASAWWTPTSASAAAPATRPAPGICPPSTPRPASRPSASPAVPAWQAARPALCPSWTGTPSPAQHRLPTWTCKEEQQWLNIMAGQARSCALT